MRKKNFSLGVLLFLLFAVILVSGCTTKTVTDTDEKLPEKLPDADTPEQIIQEPLLEKLSDEAIMAIITQQIAEQFTKEPAEISAKVSHSDSEHLRGSFEFEGLTTPNVFFAINIDGEWRIIFTSEANAISCEEIGHYGFPAEMTADCIVE